MLSFHVVFSCCHFVCPISCKEIVLIGADPIQRPHKLIISIMLTLAIPLVRAVIVFEGSVRRLFGMNS